MSTLPYLERVKIQSEILLPLFRRLRDELGAERANAMLREAVTEFAEAFGRKAGEGEGSSLDKVGALMPAFAAGGALEVEPLVHDERELRLNVRRCAYAEYFRELGEPEFGAMVTCEIDPPMTRAIGADLTLNRTQTILGGGSHCDFQWKLG